MAAAALKADPAFQEAPSLAFATSSTAVTAFSGFACAGVFAAYSLLVAHWQLSVLQTILLLWAPATAAAVLIRAVRGLPPTMAGNRLPARFGGKRFQLVIMPVNHFGEKLRWVLDLLGAPYEESTVGGLLSMFIRGRSVPWLVDRQSCSLIGNSDEACWYLGALLIPAMSEGPGKEAAIALMRRDRTTLEWEQKLNSLGHAIQGWAYHYVLGGRCNSDFSLIAWGGREPLVSWWERGLLQAAHPLLVAAMNMNFCQSDENVHKARHTVITSLLDDVDAALEKNDYLTGSQLSYVDIAYCSLMCPLFSSTVKDWAKGRFTSFEFFEKRIGIPPELLSFEEEALKRPCGKHVGKVYSEWRRKSLRAL